MKAARCKITMNSEELNSEFVALLEFVNFRLYLCGKIKLLTISIKHLTQVVIMNEYNKKFILRIHFPPQRA